MQHNRDGSGNPEETAPQPEITQLVLAITVTCLFTNNRIFYFSDDKQILNSLQKKVALNAISNNKHKQTAVK